MNVNSSVARAARAGRQSGMITARPDPQDARPVDERGLVNSLEIVFM